MKLEVGKTYEMANGGLVEITKSAECYDGITYYGSDYLTLALDGYVGMWLEDGLADMFLCRAGTGSNLPYSIVKEVSE